MTLNAEPIRISDQIKIFETQPTKTGQLPSQTVVDVPPGATDIWISSSLQIRLC